MTFEKFFGLKTKNQPKTMHTNKNEAKFHHCQHVTNPNFRHVQQK